MRRSAFTLIEVLVALTVLSVGIVGTLAAIVIANRWAAAGVRLNEAVRLAQRELTTAMAVGPELTEARSESTGPYAWTLSYIGRPHGLVVATVSVNWSEGGVPKSFVLSQVFKPRESDQRATGPTDIFSWELYDANQ